MKFFIFALMLGIAGCGGGDSTATNSSGGTVSGTTTINVSVPNAPSSYTINSMENPTIVVTHGIAYTFNLNATGHPFYIKTSPSTGSANALGGVTNNGAETGSIVWTPSSTGTFYYNCSIHSSMTGAITVQ